MVDREKLSLWSSDGVRNLLVRTEERRENVAIFKYAQIILFLITKACPQGKLSRALMYLLLFGH